MCLDYQIDKDRRWEHLIEEGSSQGKVPPSSLHICGPKWEQAFLFHAQKVSFWPTSPLSFTHINLLTPGSRADQQMRRWDKQTNGGQTQQRKGEEGERLNAERSSPGGGRRGVWPLDSPTPGEDCLPTSSLTSSSQFIPLRATSTAQ